MIEREECGDPAPPTDDDGADDPAPSKASMAIDPSSYSYGNVVTHSSAEKTFILTNSGDVEVAITNVELIGASADKFSIDSSGGSFLIGVGNTHEVVVSFNPTSGGSEKATLRLYLLDGTYDVDLSGTGKKLATGSEFTIVAAADAYVRSSKANRNYGKSKSLIVRNASAIYKIYLKFEVSGMPDEIQSAILRLVSDAASGDGGTIYRVESNDWDEYGITWDNAPAATGDALGSAGAVSVGEVVEFDVSKIVKSNGTFSFCINSNSTNKTKYLSKEKSDKTAPVLLIDLAPSPAPAITAIDPKTGSVGTEVTLAGLNFTGANEVEINGTQVSDYTIKSDNEITMRVPSGAVSGRISVITRGGVANSDETFEVRESRRYTFPALHDTYVRSSRPGEKNGNAGSLQIRISSAIRNIYLKFDVSGVEGKIQNAKIRLFCTDGSDQAGSAYQVSNDFEGTTTPWTEKDLNWSNAPQTSGIPLSSAGAVLDDEYAEFDVMDAISGNGTYSFAIADGTLDRAKYRSKEKGKANEAPELIIESVATVVAKASAPADEIEIEAEEPLVELPRDLRLGSGYPNPFNAETTIEYDLPAASDVSLVVFNVRGQHVRTLVSGVQKPGTHKVQWDGRNGSMSLVATGTYIIRLQAGQNRLVRKVTLVK